jgi:hypothetical protein
MVWTTETREAAVTEMRERLVEVADGEVNVSEALEILARGVRW